ncbi:hypothetical protein UA08_09379 [Talaromyces atroroseus]|uniref:Tryprostatin B 6-hydroxylase n=1 Tax=Talaromyces atroroseus TaxID=1441469 RepID=A0A1Q5Q6J9_TALAT|nr:hypothetical protein UA08_09379 [Talaromyces atroroseus]OKL55370.1 hypothetical protein UA08_09379 [Talaromyces atroroseus]
MSSIIPSPPWLYSAATGVAAHVTLFRHGEWDGSAPNILISYLVVFTILNVKNLAELVTGVKDQSAFQLLSCHFVGLYGSIIVYRVFFHRLRKFPGPLAAAVTALYASFLPAKRLNKFEEVGKLHRKYGDYMRLGPRELSIADPRAVPFIYGPASKTTKGPFYDGGEPYISVHTTRNKLEHARRRKAWDRAFSFRSLRDYEHRVSRYSAQLLSAIAENVSRPIDMARWFNYYSFDVMGDLTFGKSFEMLVTGKDAYMLETLHKDMQSMGPFLHAMWILPLFKKIPILNKSYLTYCKWLNAQVDIRTKNEPEKPDVFTQLSREFQAGAKTEKDRLHFHGDVNVAVIAGSDTTASTLTNLFYELASSPEFTRMLQSEIDSVKEKTYQELSQMKLLNAAIEETLRLHPAIPSGMQRVTPKKGVQIDDTYIPGECLVQMPLYSLFRDERCFAQPNQFIPQRWTDRQDLIKDASVYIPFGLGPFSCAGKQLALMEIRRVTVDLLSRYDVSFAKGQTHEAFYQGQQDVFTLVCGKLQLLFTERVSD